MKKIWKEGRKKELKTEGKGEEIKKERRKQRRRELKKKRKQKEASCWLQTGQTSSPGLPGYKKLRGKWWASVEGASGGLGQKLSVQGAGA